LHKHDLERDGVGMEFKGTLTLHEGVQVSPSQVNAVDAREAEIRGILEVLRDVYAIAQTGEWAVGEEYDNEAMMDRAKQLLEDYGIDLKK
jgi:hypothetical protein